MRLSMHSMLLAMMLLSGCSAWDNYIQEKKQQESRQIADKERAICNSGWDILANQSAANGYANQDAMSYYQQLCLKHNYQFDQQAWQKGYQEGMAIYCSNLQAYQLGKAEYPYYVEKCTKVSNKKRTQLVSSYQLGWTWAKSASQLDLYDKQIQRYDEWIETRENENYRNKDDKDARAYQRELWEIKRERAEMAREQQSQKNERIRQDNQNLSLIMQMNQ